MKMIFDGSFGELRALVGRIDSSGEWREVGGAHQYVLPSGAVINWWSTTGTVTLQGQVSAVIPIQKELSKELVNRRSAPGKEEQQHPFPPYLFSKTGVEENHVNDPALVQQALKRRDEQLVLLEHYYPNHAFTQKVIRCKELSSRKGEGCDCCSEGCFTGDRCRVIALPLSAMTRQNTLNWNTVTLSFALPEWPNAPLGHLSEIGMADATAYAENCFSWLVPQQSQIIVNGLIEAELCQTRKGTNWNIFTRALVSFSPDHFKKKDIAELLADATSGPKAFLPAYKVRNRFAYPNWRSLRPIPEGNLTTVSKGGATTRSALTGLADVEYSIWLDANPMSDRLVRYGCDPRWPALAGGYQTTPLT